MSNKLYCGVAKSDITPSKELLNHLYGLMGVPYAGIIDPLFLRVIALADEDSTALLISFDLDKAPNPHLWLPEISVLTDIPIENITYIGTHTHSAPVISLRKRENHKMDLTDSMIMATNEYENTVHEKLLETVTEAINHMLPAKMGYGKGQSFINTNRAAEFDYEAEDGTIYTYVSQGPNSAGEVDRTVFVLSFESEDGKPMAFFVNYALHCCIMFLNKYDENGSMGISGDLAGTVSRYIEAKYPDSVAIWSSGAAGDVNPIIANEVFYPSPKDGTRQLYMFPDYRIINEMMISLASRHFKDIVDVIRGIDQHTGDVRIKGIVEWSETDAYQMEFPKKGEFKIAGDSEAPYRIRMHLLRLGDVALMGIGGELFSSLGKMIREIAPLTNTVIINHEASLIEDSGYILDDQALEKVRKDTPVKGFLPGCHSPAKSGQVAKSLKKHTRSMFEKVLI